MKKHLRVAALTAALCSTALGASSSALAAGPTGDQAEFKYCPYNNPVVEGCVVSTTTSGSFKLGNANVPITSSTPIVLQGGVGPTDAAGNATFYGAVGADTLSKTRLKVPGGLLGLVDTGGLTGALIAAFNRAVASVNDVYATAEVAGPIVFSGDAFLSNTGTAISLPVKIHLQNPFLGPDCYIGSNSKPVQLNLTTGTTAPPPPNVPISGTFGAVSFNSDETIIQFRGDQLVNNSFAAPAASNCGFLLLDKLLITGAVNLKEGLPAAAGKNTAILGGDTDLGNVQAVRNSVQ
jgi:hypothetical protein